MQHGRDSWREIKDDVWSEVISWVEQRRVLEKTEMRGKAREVLVTCSMFDLKCSR